MTRDADFPTLPLNPKPSTPVFLCTNKRTHSAVPRRGIGVIVFCKRHRRRGCALVFHGDRPAAWPQMVCACAAGDQRCERVCCLLGESVLLIGRECVVYWESVCCLLVLNSVTSTPSMHRGRWRERVRCLLVLNLNSVTSTPSMQRWSVQQCEDTKQQQHTATNKKFRERGEEYLLIHDGLAPDL